MHQKKQGPNSHSSMYYGRSNCVIVTVRMCFIFFIAESNLKPTLNFFLFSILEFKLKPTLSFHPLQSKFKSEWRQSEQVCCRYAASATGVHQGHPARTHRGADWTGGADLAGARGQATHRRAADGSRLLAQGDRFLGARC